MGQEHAGPGHRQARDDVAGVDHALGEIIKGFADRQMDEEGLGGRTAGAPEPGGRHQEHRHGKRRKAGRERAGRKARDEERHGNKRDPDQQETQVAARDRGP